MNNSVMKCCICNNKNIGEFITINNNKYHLCCIEQLKEQRQELRNWLEEQMNICDGVISTRTSDFQELGGRSAGKTFIQTEILKNKVALKSFELALNKLNELEGKNVKNS